MKVVQWIVYLIACGGLIGCILENVVGLTHETSDGHEPTSEKFLRVLRKWCPDFAWRLDTLHLVDYMLPQTRVRVFLRGMRKSVAPEVPPPLLPFGKRLFRDSLGKSQNVVRESLGETFQENLKCCGEVIKSDHRKGKLSLGDLIVCPLDRSHRIDITYLPSLTRNAAPTLTTQNSCLFVMSVSDVVHGVDDASRKFFRFFTKPERLALQGFPPHQALRLPENKIVFAAGNAYPVPLIVATLHPMLKSLVDSGLDLCSHPAPEMLSATVPASIPKILKALAAPGRVTNKDKHATYLAKKRKRCRSDSR